MFHAVDVAITQLGICELTGNNDGVPADRYMRGDKLAWCAGFVLYCYDVSDDPDIWDDDDDTTKHDDRRFWGLRAVSALEEWAKTMGVWIGPRVIPASNDVIFYGSRKGSDAKKGGMHTGIVEFVDDNGIHTVEGNLGDSVKRRTVKPGNPSITGFARFARRVP